MFELSTMPPSFWPLQIGLIHDPQIGIGVGLAAAPLPHHRTYGSVSGGSLDQARAMFRAGAEGSDGVVRCVGFGPFEQRVRASPFPVAAKARYWNSAAWPTQGLRVYAFFQRSGLRQSALAYYAVC